MGIHAHNDGECAVANSLAAVQAGCTQVQGTINGYGERCGNANLCSIIPDLQLKLGYECLPPEKLVELYDLSHFVAEIANLAPDEYQAYVGQAAFAHKGGVHVAAMRRSPLSYQHIEPELVGNEMSVVVSELSGKGNILSKAEEYGLAVNGSKEVADALNQIKELESQGFSFEAAEASAMLLLKRHQPDYRAPFELIDYSVSVEHRQQRGIITEAMVKVRIGEKVIHTAGEGCGPVNALDVAMRKALVEDFPQIAQFPPDRFQSAYPQRRAGYGSHHARVDRHSKRLSFLEHSGRQPQYHRCQLAGFGRLTRVWFNDNHGRRPGRTSGRIEERERRIYGFQYCIVARRRDRPGSGRPGGQGIDCGRAG